MSQVIVELDIPVPMRDGITLMADIYRPAGEGPFPTIVTRTPYDKSNGMVHSTIQNPVTAAERGYAVIVQDIRGRFESEGDCIPFVHEADDGYDTVEWAAAQPWSTGKVGIFGGSGLGVTTWQAVLAKPPHLVAALPVVTGTNYHEGWVYSGGAMELGFILSWAHALSGNTMTRVGLSMEQMMAAGGRFAAAFQDDLKTALDFLPIKDNPLFADGVAPYWEDWVDHPSYGEYWEKVDVLAQLEKIDIPVLHISGWYDIFLRAHTDIATAVHAHGDERLREHHHMLIGPWEHTNGINFAPSNAGERNFGLGALAMGVIRDLHRPLAQGRERRTIRVPEGALFPDGRQ